MRFDLSDLRLFLSVTEHGSLTAGAGAVNLALASASERVAGMEAVLGTPLLERSRRGVRSTAAGDALIRHARIILAQVEQMRGELRMYGAGLKGRVRLLSNTAAMAVLPDRLRPFLVAHPDLSIDLEECPSVDIVLALADGRADLGIAADIADLAALQTRLFAEDRLVVLVGSGHRLARAKSVAFADVVEEPFVGIADAALEAHLGERAARLGRQLQYRVHLRSLAGVARMVEAGVGIAIVSNAALDEVGHPGPAAAPLVEPWAQRRLYLCARDFAALTPQAALLAKHLQ